MAICIHLSDKWYITSDKYSYQLSQFEGIDKRGIERWKPQKFAGNINHILHAWIEQKLRECDATTFQEFLAELRKCRERLDEIATYLDTQPVS